MKKNEPFNPDNKSQAPLNDLVFRPACSNDTQTIFHLMALRNPHFCPDELLVKTQNEVENLNDGKSYGLFVAEYQNQVIGFCRFYHSKSVPENRIKYPAPSGYYGMGIIVHPDFRRRGVARFLTQNRFQWLKEQGADCMYSAVASDNLTSLHMHKEFGYQEIQRADGFLTLNFEDVEGVLFKKEFISLE